MLQVAFMQVLTRSVVAQGTNVLPDRRKKTKRHIDNYIVIYDNVVVMSERSNRLRDFVRLTSLVRRLFHRLAAVWTELHQDLGVSASMRAVMESLMDGDRTVPDVAREKDVSRQHIQTVVNQLGELGLTRSIPNPSHQKSALISLTESGRTVLKTIFERERDLLPLITREFQEVDLHATADALQHLLDYFERTDRSPLVTRTSKLPQRKERSK
jgi:DNA-binding MarR family transcriptional regulator